MDHKIRARMVRRGVMSRGPDFTYPLILKTLAKHAGEGYAVRLEHDERILR